VDRTASMYMVVAGERERAYTRGVCDKSVELQCYSQHFVTNTTGVCVYTSFKGEKLQKQH
jgi:hypothetical protein